MGQPVRSKLHGVLVLTEHSGEHESFVGCTYGSVELAPDHPAWLGATTTDNIAAELTAMIVAQQTVLRWHEDASFTVRPDLTLSRLLAQAITVCKSNRILAQICQAQGLWLSKRMTIHEVRGHTSHPWNDLADALAKWALTNDPVFSDQEAAPLHHFCSMPAWRSVVVDADNTSLHVGLLPPVARPASHADHTVLQDLGNHSHRAGVASHTSHRDCATAASHPNRQRPCDRRVGQPPPRHQAHWPAHSPAWLPMAQSPNPRHRGSRSPHPSRYLPLPALYHSCVRSQDCQGPALWLRTLVT